MTVANNSPKLDKIFEALAHKKRRGMLHTLSFRPATVGQLAKEQKLSLPMMHKHIRILEEARLIARRKSGRTNFVALNKQTFGMAQAWMNRYNVQWGNDKESLSNYIARMTE